MRLLPVVLIAGLLICPFQATYADDASPAPAPAPTSAQSSAGNASAFQAALKQVNLTTTQKKQIKAIVSSTPSHKGRYGKIMAILSPAQQTAVKTFMARHKHGQ